MTKAKQPAVEHRLLVFIPSGRDATLTEQLLGDHSIAVTVCRTVNELANGLQQGLGALLTSEEALGSCSELLRQFIGDQAPWSDLPVLLLTRSGVESWLTQRAVQNLGNVTLIERPVRTLALVSLVNTALRARLRQYQMRAVDERKNQFLAVLAHELRNPLAPIVNAASIFERLHPGEQTSKLVSMVQRQVGHLTRLIDDLMDVARINSGKIELQKANTTVQAVVLQAMEFADQTLRVRQHRVVVDLPEQPLHLMADAVRLIQSVANLVVNAAKYTPTGGEIQVRAEACGGEVVIEVRDNGVGLSHQALTSIFEMFAQERRAGEPSTGLGIGLHLTKVFVELHGGRLSAHSDGVDRGTRFEIHLPLGHPLAPTAALPWQPMGRRCASPLVLIVDDNEDAAYTLAGSLQMEGMRTLVANNGPAAIELASEHRPDVMVMDIGMAGMNGYEAAQTIRRYFPEGGGPLLIALTGWGQAADKARAHAAGFDAHLVKPVAMASLLQLLERLDPDVAGL